MGIPEDPVTGSAHCLLAPYWSSKLGIIGSVLNGYQASKRGGVVDVQIIPSSEQSEERVLLRGKTMTIMKSFFH